MIGIVSSRAKKKNKSKASEADGGPPPDWLADEEGIPLTKRQERWLEMFFGVVVFFGAAGGFTLEIFGSWKLSLVCATAAAVLAVVLVRRGDTLF
jgi:hypothetical protein